ncbi:MAG: hypothetical protein ACO1TE_10890 [Prosthecobacter sp.]
MKTIVPASGRKAKADSKFTIPNPDMSYEAWLEQEKKFRAIMDGQAVDRRPASVIVREGRR